MDLFVIVDGEARPIQEINKINAKKLKIVDKTGKIIFKSIEKEVLLLKLLGGGD